MAMRARVLQHVPFESPGSIATTLRALGATVEITRLFAGDRLPAISDVDALVVMGGPMSVNDEAEFPWLAAEKRLVAAAVASESREITRTVVGFRCGS